MHECMLLTLSCMCQGYVFRKAVEDRWADPALPGGASAHFRHSVVSDSLQPHGLQHTRPVITSLMSNSCLLSRWCHPTISSSGTPFSSCLQSFPASGSFPISHFFTSGGQSIGTSAFSINIFNKYSGLITFRIDWFNLLAVQETPKSLLQRHNSKASIFSHSAFFIVQLSHP